MISPRESMLNRFIERNGKRHTPERLQVLSVLESLKSTFTIDDVVTELDARKIPLSRGTVVNTVGLMKEAGLIVVVGQCNRNVLYQLTGRTPRRSKIQKFPFNIILQCLQCGLTKDIRDKAAVAGLTTRRYSAFTPVNGVVTVYGLCNKCHNSKENK